MSTQKQINKRLKGIRDSLNEKNRASFDTLSQEEKNSLYGLVLKDQKTSFSRDDVWLPFRLRSLNIKF